MVGLTSARSDEFWRSTPVDAARTVLHTPAAAPQVRHDERRGVGDRAARGAASCHHDPHPWDDLWLDVAVEHPLRDAVVGRAQPHCRCSTDVDIPVYLGCDWQNVPLHLPSTFIGAGSALTQQPECAGGHARRVRADLAVGEPARRGAGLVRPLAQGPRHRHPRRRRRSATCCPATDEWRTRPNLAAARATSPSWRCAPTARSSADEGAPGDRAFMVLGAGLGRAKPSPIDPPSLLTWTSAPLTEALDVVGDIELRLDATATAIDTAWIVTLSGRRARRHGRPTSPPAGCGPACARSTRPRAGPARRCCPAAAPRRCPIGEDVDYRIPLVPNARRFAAGHRIRLTHHQRRPGSGDAGHHELPARQRRHQQPQHGAGRRRGWCCRWSRAPATKRSAGPPDRTGPPGATRVRHRARRLLGVTFAAKMPPHPT